MRHPETIKKAEVLPELELGRYRYLKLVSVFSTVFFHVSSVFGIGISDVNLLISGHLDIVPVQSITVRNIRLVLE